MDQSQKHCIGYSYAGRRNLINVGTTHTELSIMNTSGEGEGLNYVHPFDFSNEARIPKCLKILGKAKGHLVFLKYFLNFLKVFYH